MEIRSNAEWQHGRSLVECNQYMLENELYTDVCFEVGPSDGRSEIIRAHKYVLISRSTVFEAMFCGGMAESHADKSCLIPITDVDVDSFRQMIKFMYCEEANISADTALPLMYAAKKYLLLNLVDRCQKFLQENLDIENVCCILELSLIFDENQLRERCLAFIGKFTPEVLKTDGFLQISRSTLEELVKFNILTISEVNLFNACIVWARHQLQLDNTVSAANDAAIRDCLGSVLYRVRFPNIGQEEFARTFGKCGILSSEEKLALYYYFNTKEDKENLPFDGQLRRAHEDVVSRFGSIATGEWIMNGRVDAIDFMTDRDIVLIGLGLYGSPTPGSHDMSVEIWNGKILLCIVATKFESTGTETQPVKVYLGPKVKLKANTNNTIVTMIKGSNTRYGCNGKSKVVSGGITFIFSSSQKHTGRTGIECGQIPELYFTSPELRN